MKIEKHLNIVIVIVCVAVVACLSYLSLRDPWLWYDESGQFWISKGLNHYSVPYLPTGGLADVIENNRHYNADPGGFSVLLYFWMLISDSSTFFLRLLPYLFFVGFAAFSFMYIYRCRRNIAEAAVYASLLFMWKVTATNMVEIRAYSMEMLGVISTIYFLPHLFISEKKPLRLLMLGIWLSVFCWSRYDFVIFAFCVSLWVLYNLYVRKGSFVGFLKESLVYAAPLLLTVGGIFFCSMVYQNPSAAPLGYLRYLGTSPKLLSSPLFLFSLLNVLLILYDFYKRKFVPDTHKLFLIVIAVYFVLSVLNKCPWEIDRSIALTLLLLFTLMERLLQMVNVHAYINILLVVTLCRTVQNNEITGVREEKGHDLYREYIAFRNHHNTGKTFVDRWLSPTLRYSYEYGFLKDKAREDGYPGIFYLQKDRKHSKYKADTMHIVMPTEVDCDYYIISYYKIRGQKDIMSEFESLNDDSQYLYVKKQK